MMFSALFHRCAVLHECVAVYAKCKCMYIVLLREWNIMSMSACLCVVVIGFAIKHRARDGEKKDECLPREHY